MIPRILSSLAGLTALYYLLAENDVNRALVLIVIGLLFWIIAELLRILHAIRGLITAVWSLR